VTLLLKPFFIDFLQRHGPVYITSHCPKHGDLRTIICLDSTFYLRMVGPQLPSIATADHVAWLGQNSTVTDAVLI
jgi:hypothetical protein